MNLIDSVERWATEAPDRIAHVSGDRQWTYADLLRRSNAVASELGRLLPSDRSPVAVHGHKEPEMLAAFLGSIKAGHAYVPIDAGLPAHRVDRVVELSGAKVTLTPDTIAALPDVDAEIAPYELAPDDAFYIMFTSGSTGEPKGVVITLGCLNSFLEWMHGEHRFEPGETFLNVVPYSFDVSWMDTYMALTTGGTVFSIRRQDVENPRELFGALTRSDATVWVSTPSFAAMCLVERRFCASMLPRLRRFLFCGETLPPQVASQLLDRFPDAEVWNTYGPTEATVATTSVRIDRDIVNRFQSLPIGFPMPGSRLLVVDDGGNQVPDGTRGELIIAGPHVSPGYLGRPDLTQRAFLTIDGMRAYRTGDWAHVTDGMLFFDGRRDNQIKLHGYRVELADIEANLRALTNVRDAVVLPVVSNTLSDHLVAFILLADGSPSSASDDIRMLRHRLAERVPGYMVPRKFRLVDAFPMTPNGKVDRKVLAQTL